MSLIKTPELYDLAVPYRNKSFKNLRGERWEDIPGMDGYYLISNHGRIKSLARDILYQDGRVGHKKSRILMAGITKTFNHFTKDYSYQLGICLHYQNIKYDFSVARLVYHCFVEPFDLEDYAVFIIQNDGNGLNCHYKNLTAINRTVEQERIFLRKRAVSCFTWIDMKAVVQKGIRKRYQPVTQYNSSGKRIQTYESIKAASEATGVAKTGITAVLMGYWQRSGGFVWQRGKGPARINLEGYFDQGKIAYKGKRGKKIDQLTKEGKLFKQYPSILDAAKATGIPKSNISLAVNDKLHTAGGYVWRETKKRSSSARQAAHQKPKNNLSSRKTKE